MAYKSNSSAGFSWGFFKIEVINSGPKYTRVFNITNNHLHLSGGWAIMGMIEALNRGVHALIPSTMEVIYNKIYMPSLVMGII